MKKILLFATAAALFAACSSDNLSVNNQQAATQPSDGAVAFDVYTQKASTRAGVPGSLTATLLKDYSTPSLFNKAGFGVFGYYTDNNEYEQRSVPNFMYNQQVTYDASGWNYKPVMYWPNEYGDKAISDDSDKLTFFAYAPWVDIIPTSGKVKNTNASGDPDNTKELESYGIVSMTRNSTQGDPILKYIASFNANKSVDLCWGVADNNDGMAWDLTQTGTAQTPAIANGMPWINVERPASTNQKVKFTFKHATAQMRVNIDADIDIDGRGEGNPVEKKTRVWVREVTFKGFALKGSLNLNNDEANKAKWLDYNGQNELVAEDVTIYDGRKDGKEGVAGAVATNEKTLGLNPTLIQDGVYEKGSGTNVYDPDNDVVVHGVDATGAIKNETTYERKGVTNATVNLFAQKETNESEGTKDAIFHVIPVENENFEVEIVYDIETVDENLAQNLSDGATKGSSIENRISKKISFGSETQLKAGHSYTLNLHLGMTSVKFDAAVSDWIEEDLQDVDLPLNIPAFAAANPVVTKDVTIPYTGNYTFAITGLDGGESVAYDEDPANDAFDCTPGAANKSGMAIQTLTANVNPKTIDRDHTATWTGRQSSKGVKVKFTQKAHPLYMTISSLTNSASNGVITLKRWNDVSHSATSDWGTETTGWFCDGAGSALEATNNTNIKVWRNGTLLTHADAPSGNKYTFSNDGNDDQTNTITLGEKMQVGDVIKVTLQTGDAPEETVTARYDGMYFVESTKSIPYRQTGTVAIPEVKNAYGTVTYSITSNPGTASVDPSTGAITTTTPGTTTITATDQSLNTATLTLTVTKQKTEIIGVNDEPINQPVAAMTLGSTVRVFSASVKGEVDNPAGDVKYNYYSAILGTTSVKTQFLFDHATKTLKTNANLSAGTYKLRFLIDGEVDEEKYEKPARKDITITLVVG